MLVEDVFVKAVSLEGRVCESLFAASVFVKVMLVEGVFVKDAFVGGCVCKGLVSKWRVCVRACLWKACL